MPYWGPGPQPRHVPWLVNWTGDSLVCRLALNPICHTCQGCTNLFFIIFCISVAFVICQKICIFSFIFNIKMATQKVTNFGVFLKGMLIWQLPQYNLTNLFQMKLKTAKRYLNHLTGKNKTKHFLAKQVSPLIWPYCMLSTTNGKLPLFYSLFSSYWLF